MLGGLRVPITIPFNWGNLLKVTLGLKLALAGLPSCATELLM